MASPDDVESLLEKVRRLVAAGQIAEPLVLGVSQRADISAEDGLSLPDGDTPLMQFSRVTLDDTDQQTPIPTEPTPPLDLSAIDDAQLRALVRQILHEELERLGVAHSPEK